MIHDSFLSIIQKHISYKLIIGYTNDNMGLTVEPITLKDVNKKGIVADFLRSGYNDYTLNFYNDMFKNILFLYNMNNIDLLIAKKVLTLGEKLKDKALQKSIINNLKVSIGKKVMMVNKQGTDYVVNNGIFQNMGIVGISLTVPPFYNRTEMIKYPSVINIYDESFNDLLNVD